MLKKIFSTIKNWVLKNKWWTTLIIFVVIIILFVFLGGKENTTIEFVTVQKHNIIEEVNATGNIKPISDLDLSFETSGQVSRVAVSVGDKVYQGQYLASLSNADLSANVELAKAGLKVAQAKLTEMKSGTRPEELAVAENTLSDSITGSYTICDDAIRNDVDQMFDNPRTESAEIVIPMNDFQLKNNINKGRYAIESILNTWNKNPSVSSILALSYIDSIKTFLDKVALALSSLSANSSILQTTIDKYKTAISTARAAIDLARSNITSAKANYDLKFAGNTLESIAGQEATVEQAEANVNVAEANLSKSIIVSPINGVITNVTAKAGQTMQSGISAISIISYGKYDIESYIPEADISKIKIGDTATTTLDAYGSGVFFETSVVKIAPAETVISGVPTYKVTLKFASSSDSRIKSGMTANLDILTAQKNNVLAIPSRHIYTIDNLKYVKLIDPEDSQKTIETKIETGARGIDGYIEIISGLKEGDVVLVSSKL